MLFELLVSLMIGEINPSDFTGKTIYPSGIKDCDKDILALPASISPVLKLPMPIFDKTKNVIKPGIYQVKLIDKLLILSEGDKIIAKLPALKIRYLPYNQSISECFFKKENPELATITYRENNIEAETIAKIVKN